MKKKIKRLLYSAVILTSISLTIAWFHCKDKTFVSFVALNLLYTIAAIRAIKDYLQ